MRVTKARTLAGLAACCLVATPVLAEPSLVEKGRQALESRCSRCHAIGLEGESPHEEAPPFREVVKRYPPESLEESLAEGITSGHPDMPEFILAPDEIAAVVTYLHTLEVK
ncbi:MAG: cytochrome c [Rhizobiales bacterium]|nr:cytochrome c [Hyphomicrobiales bacterium]